MKPLDCNDCRAPVDVTSPGAPVGELRVTGTVGPEKRRIEITLCRRCRLRREVDQ